MDPLAPWLVVASAPAVLTLCWLLGLRLISPERLGQVLAGVVTGLTIGFAVSPLSSGGVHG